MSGKRSRRKGAARERAVAVLASDGDRSVQRGQLEMGLAWLSEEVESREERPPSYILSELADEWWVAHSDCLWGERDDLEDLHESIDEHISMLVNWGHADYTDTVTVWAFRRGRLGYERVASVQIDIQAWLRVNEPEWLAEMEAEAAKGVR